MICNRTDLDTAIDWLTRCNARPIVVNGPVVCTYRGHQIGRDICFGLLNDRERLDVAPWVVQAILDEAQSCAQEVR